MMTEGESEDDVDHQVLLWRLVRDINNLSVNQRRRDVFYLISNWFTHIVNAVGFRAANEVSADIHTSLVSRMEAQEILDRHSETFHALGKIAASEPVTELDEGLAAISQGSFAEGIRKYAVVHGGSIRATKKYRHILEHGPDRGFAVWQLMNPFYYVWASMPAGTEAVQNRWHHAKFDTQKNLTAADESEVTFPNPLQSRMIKTLYQELGVEPWRSGRILELGVGHGDNARLLVEAFGIPVRNYLGFDLMPGRVQTTRNLLRNIALKRREDGMDLDKQVFTLDVLASDALAKVENITPVEIVFSASFTNVFNDDQMTSVLDLLAVLQPRFIIDTSVISSWGYCHGRLDLSCHYAQIGYHKRAETFEHPELDKDDGHRLWMPEKYWANRNIMIFEK